MFGDSRENSFEILAFVIILSPISPVDGTSLRLMPKLYLVKSIYKVFYRIQYCGNKPIGLKYFKRDLDGTHAASTRAGLWTGLQETNARHQHLFFHANLLHGSDIKTSRRVRSRPVHFPGTCKNNAGARWQLLVGKRDWPRNSSEYGIAQRLSFDKNVQSAQT